MFLKLLLAFSLYLNVIKTQPLEDLSKAPGIPLQKLGSRQYYVQEILEGNLYDSEDFVNSLGLDLLAIESKEENDALAPALSKFPGIPFWTSGVSTESGWVWTSNNQTIKHFYWGEGQPDNKNTKFRESGIAVYYSQEKKQVVWDDRRFEEYLDVIGEVKK